MSNFDNEFVAATKPNHQIVCEVPESHDLNHDSDEHAANTQVDTSHSPSVLAYVVYTFVALFLFYEMALQVSPSIMTEQLMHDLHIDAVAIGLISGIYFYSYMSMQIPSGLFFDRYPTRFLIPSAIIICTLGTFIFASSHTVWAAGLGRFLMGIGSACAFIAVLVVSNRWFPARYFSFLVGIAQFLAALGAMGGEAPLAIFIHHVGWRQSLNWLIVIGLILAMVIWFLLKNEPPLKIQQNAKQNDPSIWQHLKTIFRTHQNWWIAIYAFCGWAPVATFASLWGMPYLMRLYHISSAQAATAVAMIWIGLMIGSPFFGWYSTKTGKRLPFLRGAALLGLITSVAIIGFHSIPFSLMYLLLLGFGIATSGQILTFALINETNRPEVTATGMGFNNMAVVAGGALLQPLVGFLLHRFWNGQIHHHIPIYSVNNYRFALTIIPLCFLVAWISSLFFIKETYCKSAY